MRANNEGLGVSREISGIGTVYNSTQVWTAFTSSNAEFLCLYGTVGSPERKRRAQDGIKYLLIDVELEISKSARAREGGGFSRQGQISEPKGIGWSTTEMIHPAPGLVLPPHPLV